MQRRKFIQLTAMSSAAIGLSKYSFSEKRNDFPDVRTPINLRKFSSPAVEKIISSVKNNIRNKEIAWLFGNCFPNTLDTTVDFEMINGKPDTYVITGDIDAMWLRDSSAQIWPYIPLCNSDKNLKQLIKGVINRQVKCILRDPYANAFYKDENKISEWKETDITDMKPGIHERKWEIDSLCYPVRLAHGYWKETRDTSVFDNDWLEAMRLIIQTFKQQQRYNGRGPYSFQRRTSWATDGVPLEGYGYPAKPNGLICSMFRPSDDATIFPYLIPSNFFAVESLKQMQELTAMHSGGKQTSNQAGILAGVVKKALEQNAIINDKKSGNIYAYEINGYGSFNLMDDANVPSLLSLPYLDTIKRENSIYQNTRKFILSENNPFFFQGTAGEGIGSPHTGLDMIWPIAIIMRGLTSNNDAEIKYCIKILQKSSAGTGFMHESFNKNEVGKFTRKWFAWANTLFGEFVWKLYQNKPGLLN
jgi:hypothetical protein